MENFFYSKELKRLISDLQKMDALSSETLEKLDKHWSRFRLGCLLAAIIVGLLSDSLYMGFFIAGILLVIHFLLIKHTVITTVAPLSMGKKVQGNS